MAGFVQVLGRHGRRRKEVWACLRAEDTKSSHRAPGHIREAQSSQPGPPVMPSGGHTQFNTHSFIPLASPPPLLPPPRTTACPARGASMFRTNGTGCSPGGGRPEDLADGGGPNQSQALPLVPLVLASTRPKKQHPRMPALSFL